MVVYRVRMGDQDAVEHSGVKGMKWGVWNEETRAKYEGGKRPRVKISKEASKAIHVGSLTTALSAAGASAAATAVLGKKRSPLSTALKSLSVGVATMAISEVHNRHSYKKGLDATEKLTSQQEIERVNEVLYDNAFSNFALGTAVGTAAYTVGRTLVSSYTSSAAIAEATSHLLPHSAPGNLLGAHTHPHPHGNGPSNLGGITELLSNADIPDSLKKR